jgi:cyclophilin family peptidyl-prolyl cis-trans isomerase
MGTSAEKHARQKERRNRLEEAQAEIDKKARTRRIFTNGGLAAVVILVIAGVVFWPSSKDDSSKDSAKGSTTTLASTTTVAGAAELPTPPKGLTLTEPTPCPPAGGSAKRVQKFAGPPPTCIDPAKSYSATFDTTEGTFTAALDAKRAPVTVNNFVVLSRYHFYDGVPFHRIVPDFVIQAGDGDGAPWGNNDLGYSIQDELPASSDEYKDSSLAMANAGPNTNGSQFFIVLPGGGPKLNPANYSLFGQVTQGQDVVTKIGTYANGEAPTKAVVIKTVTINES